MGRPYVKMTYEVMIQRMSVSLVKMCRRPVPGRRNGRCQIQKEFGLFQKHKGEASVTGAWRSVLLSVG